MQIWKYGKILKRTRFTPNEIVNCGKHSEIIIYNNKCNEIARTLIDKEDIEKVKGFKWCLNSSGYAITTYQSKFIFLHHFLIGYPLNGLEVDHINHNPLDNRKQNLRIVTRSQNSMNRKNAKGICWCKKSKKWMAHIEINQKPIYLGSFVKEQDALNARKKAEIKYFGKYRYKL